MEVKLKAIQFNHQENLACFDAFTIRQNETLTIPFPEWTPDQNFPAAYARDAIEKNKITIKAKFTWSDTTVPSIWVQALDGHGNKTNVLGIVPSTQVSKNNDFVDLTLRDVRLDSVSKSDVIWRWQFSLTPNVPKSWTDIITTPGQSTTTHHIYTVLNLPTDSWEPLASSQSTNIHIPWTEVLDVACSWAAGTQDEVSATTAITEQVYALGTAGIVAYAESATYAMEKFNCTAFLDLLKTNVGAAQVIDCDDCATIVSTFTNILGCDLYQSEMGYVFHTNRVKEIGAFDFANTGFPRHAVAWKFPCDADSALYDACLELDKRGSLGGIQAPVPLLATNLPFGSGSQREADYKFCLLRNLPGDRCEPKPKKKTRRQLGTSYFGSRRFDDQDYLVLLKKIYGFGSWPNKDAFSKITRAISIEDLLRSPSFQGWDARPSDSQADHDLTVVATVLLIRPAKQVVRLVDLNLYESSPPDSPNSFLLQLLAQFQRTDFERQVESELGDISFIAPQRTAVIFRRGKFSSVIRSVGKSPTSVVEFAQAVDKYFKGLFELSE